MRIHTCKHANTREHTHTHCSDGVVATRAALAAVVARYAGAAFRDTASHMERALAAPGAATLLRATAVATHAASYRTDAAISLDAFTALVSGACDACF